MAMIRKEQWVWVLGFEGDYQVSSVGRVRSFLPWRGVPLPRLITPIIGKRGHRFVRFYRGGACTTVSLGKVILTAFKGPPVAPRIWACHGDGNPANNALTNLRWGTNSENQMDRVLHGTSNRGASNGRAKLQEWEALDIKTRIAMGERNRDICVDYPELDPSIVSAIRTGRNWGHLKV